MELPNFDGITTDTAYTVMEKAYAGDVLRQKVHMKNPYVNKDDTGDVIGIASGLKKMFIPQYHRMYKSWKEKPV